MCSELVLFGKFWGEKEKKEELRILKAREGWFDRANLSPVQKTSAFATVFTSEVRKAIREFVDDTPASSYSDGSERDYNPIKRGNCFEIPDNWDGKQIAKYMSKARSMIRARQFCDKIGIPYEFACRFVVKKFYFDRSYLRGHRTMPSVSLFANAEIRAELILAWAETVKSKCQYYDSDTMVIKKGCSDLALRHENWLISQIKMKTNPTFLCKTMLRKGYISENRIKEEFGEAFLKNIT